MDRGVNDTGQLVVGLTDDRHDGQIANTNEQPILLPDYQQDQLTQGGRNTLLSKEMFLQRRLTDPRAPAKRAEATAHDSFRGASPSPKQTLGASAAL